MTYSVNLCHKYPLVGTYFPSH